jgi:hypothetical protein
MLMKALHHKRVRFQCRDGYSDRNEHLENLSAMVVFLLNQVETKNKTAKNA